MRSQLQFIDHATGKASDCGKVLEIEVASHALNWPGVVVEKGRSPHFYPNHVSTPYFYFALGLEQALHWEAETDEGMSYLTTIPGEIWINPPETPFTHKIDEPCYFVIVAIEKATLFQHCPLSIKGKQLSFLKNYNVDDEALRGLINLFLLEVQSGGKNGSAYLNSLVSMLSVHYLNNYSDLNDLPERSVSKFGAREQQTIDALIDDRLDQPITIEEMAAALGCSKFYFLREFKKLTGQTPYQHLLEKRLECAQTMLAQGETNILTTALAVGFSDQSHFTRAFKKRFGTTPGKLNR